MSTFSLGDYVAERKSLSQAFRELAAMIGNRSKSPERTKMYNIRYGFLAGAATAVTGVLAAPAIFGVACSMTTIAASIAASSLVGGRMVGKTEVLKSEHRIGRYTMTKMEEDLLSRIKRVADRDEGVRGKIQNGACDCKTRSRMTRQLRKNRINKTRSLAGEASTAVEIACLKRKFEEGFTVIQLLCDANLPPCEVTIDAATSILALPDGSDADSLEGRANQPGSMAFGLVCRLRAFSMVMNSKTMYDACKKLSKIEQSDCEKYLIAMADITDRETFIIDNTIRQSLYDQYNAVDAAAEKHGKPTKRRQSTRTRRIPK